MSAAIRESITETFGFEPICINSALVSAQNRQRLYWVGIRQSDGTYRKAKIDQPTDKGILLKDILETTTETYPIATSEDKAHVLTVSYDGAALWNSLERHQRTMVAVPVNTAENGKARTLIASYGTKQGLLNSIGASGFGCTGVAEPVNVTDEDKSHTLKAQYYKNGIANFITNGEFGATAVAEPVCVASRGRNPENPSSREKGECLEQRFEAREDQKSNTLTTVQKDNMVAEPIKYCNDENVQHLMRNFGSKGKIVSDNDKSHTLCAAAGMGGGNGIYYAEPIGAIQSNQLKKIKCDVDKACTVMTIESHGWTNQSKTAVIEPVPECFRVKEATKQGYTDVEPGDCVDMSMPNSKTRRGRKMEDKSNCLQTTCSFFQYCGTVKTPIYEVKDGKITVKGKQYPIKLVDGYYIIRKLTVRECMRLQTVPEWYDFSCVSKTQAYKMLGNGWTCSVIRHLIVSALNDNQAEEPKQDDSVGCQMRFTLDGNIVADRNDSNWK